MPVFFAVPPTSVMADASLERGAFSAPPRTEWLPDGKRMKLLAPIAFKDRYGVTWTVPAGAEVNGSSIPEVFWPFVGGPYDGLHRNASVIHDYYCQTQTRPPDAVHKLMLDASLTSGMTLDRALELYSAVYIYGPRWKVSGRSVEVDAYDSCLREKAQTGFDEASYYVAACLSSGPFQKWIDWGISPEKELNELIGRSLGFPSVHTYDYGRCRALRERYVKTGLLKKFNSLNCQAAKASSITNSLCLKVPAFLESSLLQVFWITGALDARGLIATFTGCRR